MRKTRFALISICILGFFLTKCSKDKAPDPNSTTLTCDSTKVSYNKDIKAILDENCVSCHEPNNLSGGSDFSTYATSKAKMASALCNINANGCSVMPTSGKMADSLITKIESWTNNGFCQ